MTESDVLVPSGLDGDHDLVASWGNGMQEVIVDFLETLGQEREFSPNTIAAYRNDLVQFAQYFGNNCHPADWHALNDDVLRSYDLDLRERDYAKSTVARKLAAIKSFCTYLVEQHGLKLNPTAALSPPRVDKFVPQAITEDEVHALLDVVDRQPGPGGSRDRAMLRLLCATGLRVSELTALDIDDYLADGLVLCRRNPDRQRTVPLSPDAVDALEDYLRFGRDQLTQQRSEPALFVNQRGTRLTRQGFWLILKSYAEASNLPDITPHTLRHTFAALAVGSGTELHEVQHILGHVSISTTQVYQQVAQQVCGAGGRSLVGSVASCYDSRSSE
ncbi:MAG TPA: tyrosine-type recombinase/integrase [Thermomicrobiaceae bacterium]|nr:tyrosine-type recombinase/integrase [Thermomicrobiaceae bacterium]